jgi:hypothetical protein
MEDVAACHHIGFHARLRAQDAGHVFGLRAHQRCGGFVPMLGNPAAACHSFSFRFLASIKTNFLTVKRRKRSLGG